MKKIKLLTSLAGLSALSMGLVPAIASCSKTASNEITLNTKVSKLEVQVFENAVHASFYFKQSDLTSPTDTKVKIANLKLDGLEASSRDKLVKYRTDSAGNIQVYIDTQILRSGIVAKANEATFDLVFTNKKTNFEQTISGFKITWTEVPVVQAGCIEAKNELGEDVGFYTDAHDDQDVQYSIDGKTWKQAPREDDSPFIVEPNVTLYIKGNNPNGFNFNDEESTLYLYTLDDSEENELKTQQSTKNAGTKFTLSGTVTALLNNGGENKSISESTILGNYCYECLFYECDAITHVDKNFLPATTLTEGCYAYMFNDCPNLIQAPDLPSTTLSKLCYEYMFSGCKNLVVPPIIKATTLAVSSCYSMFYESSSLKVEKNESGRQHDNTFFSCPSGTLPDEAVEDMFKDTANEVDDPQSGESFYYVVE